MDQDRYEQEKKIYPHFQMPGIEKEEEEEKKPFNYRLLQDYEIPDWLKVQVSTESGSLLEKAGHSTPLLRKIYFRFSHFEAIA